MDADYRYTVADDENLDKLLAGNEPTESIALASVRQNLTLRSDCTGVIWADKTVPRLAHPLALIVHEDNIRRLCGRYAQLRSDFSPLSSWCHLLSPTLFASMESVLRVANLQGLEAAWVGLTIAEALLSVDKHLPSVRISACLATRSFALGRTKSLWHEISAADVLDRFDAANQICRTGQPYDRRDSRVSRLRMSLEPVWMTLTACLYPELRDRGPLTPVVRAFQALREARRLQAPDEARCIAEPLSEIVPEFAEFQNLSELSPETRLQVFDRLTASLHGPRGQSTQRRAALTFLAGYIATVAAGGSPSLTLAESQASQWPEITAWAYVIGGLGEKVLWTSAFDGLGRLVARELLRPFRLDEAPTCDFAYDELAVLIDPALRDPLVNLRIKQARSVTVALLPGVNAAIPLSDPAVAAAPRNESPRPTREDPAAALAESLWPYLRSKLDEYFTALDRQPTPSQPPPAPARKRVRKKAAGQPQLPLAADRENR